MTRVIAPGVPLEVPVVVLSTCTESAGTAIEQAVCTATGPVGLLIIAALFAVTSWEYRVLTRPNVRRLFGLS